MKLTVIGDGGWGTALALTLARNGHSVAIWGPDAAYLEEVTRTRRNPRFLPDVPLDGDLRWSAEPAEVLAGTQGIVFVVPSKFAAATLRRFLPAFEGAGRPPVVNATKGFDESTLQRTSELIRDIWSVPAPAVLSGPSLAGETARGVPTAVTIACEEPATAAFFQPLFNSTVFRTYTSTDVAGVELGGALKNVIALAAGICDGLGFGHNAKCALVTRGLAEISRLGIALGARPETFAGLSGIGDLMVTCFSTTSRNHTVGERLGKGESLDAILGGMVQVAEGVCTCASALTLARRYNVSVPIIEQIDAILHHGQSPADAVKALMTRPPRPE